MSGAKIGRNELEDLLVAQRKLTDAAAGAVGLESYMENAGVDALGLFQFCRNYLHANASATLGALEPEIEGWLVATSARMLMLGLVAGRQFPV